jgi:hypothetical protein
LRLYETLLRSSGALFKRIDKDESEGDKVKNENEWLRIIDMLAKEDVLKWSQIEELNVIQVFNKMILEREKYIEQKELLERQKFKK